MIRIAQYVVSHGRDVVRPRPYSRSYCRWSGLIPWTSPLKEPVARNDRSFGISMSKLGVWSSVVKPPIWKSENAHGWHVSHSASVAAIFIGW